MRRPETSRVPRALSRVRGTIPDDLFAARPPGAVHAQAAPSLGDGVGGPVRGPRARRTLDRVDETDLLDDDAQPICPSCGVTTNPEDDADACLECGYRIEHSETDRDAR